jgi:flagellar export protein FliJ
MPGFQFSLQTVLDYRAEEVSKVRLKVAQEEQRAVQLRQQLDAIAMAIEAAFEEQMRLMAEQTDGWHPVLAQGMGSYLQMMRERQSQAVQAVQAQEQVLAKVREELRQVRLKEKSLEKLKEKQSKAFQTKIIKAEEAVLEEVAQVRAFWQTAPTQA